MDGNNNNYKNNTAVGVGINNNNIIPTSIGSPQFNQPMSYQQPGFNNVNMPNMPRAMGPRPGLYVDVDTQNRILSIISKLPLDFVADLVMDNMNITPIFQLLQNIPFNPSTEKLFMFVNSYNVLQHLQPQPQLPPQQPQPQTPTPQHQQSSVYTPPPQVTPRGATSTRDPRIKGESPPLQPQQGGSPPTPALTDAAMRESSPPMHSANAGDPLLSPTSMQPINVKQEQFEDTEQNELDLLLDKQAADEESSVASNGVPSYSSSNKTDPNNNNNNSNGNRVGIASESAPSFTPKPVFKMAAMSKDQVQSIINLSLARIRKSETESMRDGKHVLWSALFARLLSIHEHREPTQYQNQIIEFILEDFQLRRELALQWLQNELQLSMQINQGDEGNNRYATLLINIVKKLQAKFAFDDEQDNQAFISNFILEVPVITSGLMDHIGLCCDDVNLITLGLNTLQSLILWRPLVRDQCLQCLLVHSNNANEQIRNNSIQVISDTLFSHAPLVSKIERFAIDQLFATLQLNKGPDMVGNNILENNLQLYYSICVKKPELISELLDVFPNCTPSLQQLILDRFGSVVKSIGPSNPAILSIIRVCPAGSERLLYEVIDSLSTNDRAELSPALVQAVRALYNSTSNIKYLLPVVHGLEKDEVIRLLPTFVVQPKEDVAKFVEMMSLPLAPLSPSELLVQLHLITTNTKQVIDTINLCVENTSVFKQETMAVTIQQLLGQHTLPANIMRTMIQSLTTYPHLKQFIVDMMRDLVSKQIWNMPQLWRGFLLCATKAKPESLSVIMDLPSSQFDLAINDSGELKTSLIKHLKSVKNLSIYSKNNLKALGITPGSTGGASSKSNK
ncbi:hypothetical protein SAMD00019534_085730 [Acytostelium subglobosum LB1]|uniref:hypothetical protein n=1 Tax=Acytostelium subglobosum LB1 TaxID=1410327 RepID=UPI000644B704|nr:hypothetical protein SAMD00019534_085730 [Acytostelium subglobosum LB1]GAM25398.1 hypothetical protein SAMD00019534_085730 [Acytostelium subglobosum LB1]|eukprot:XP_012751918.1 hypothetical protein SAMD00019534_085730 [Acytostelium subglobosum LB1]